MTLVGKPFYYYYYYYYTFDFHLLTKVSQEILRFTIMLLFQFSTPRYSLTYTPYQKVPSRLCFPRIRNYSTFNSFIRRSTYLPTSIIEAPMSFLQCDIQFFNNLRFVQQFPINAFTLTFPRARILDWISKLGGSMIQFSSGSDAFLLISWWKIRFP